ncbi:hypothetical protein FCZ24_22635 [Escherichia coli]|nr:hypothetical protein [Escherichia coli]MDN2031142.1 hypothetical protein [Escherichia coli]
MTISFNTIPSNTLVPLFYAEMDNQAANTAQDSGASLLIGHANNGAEIVANSLVLMPSADYARQICGAGSQLARMVEAYRQTDPFGELYVIAVPEATGAAATVTLTVTGAATESGTVNVYVGRTRVQASVTNGDNVTTIASSIGVPFFWPSAAMPNTVIDSWSSMVFLKFNGAKFSATDYPVLAKVFPSLVLPEARGDFIRIWDDGRGADGGRELLSWQAATNFSQFAGNIGEGAGHAINFHDGIAGNQPGFSRFNFTSNSVGDGVNFVAVRPRNIAFNFLVRAK